ncbi:MAG: tripartite tricarboxylate transporter substrate binding protein [Rhizobiales bacterium]|nr:tripartite tricarboxylate transporter substrate binding protein [Hyphomicrobiales bacterium]
MKRRTFCLAVVCAMLAPFLANAQESYPSRPVRVILGFPPGAATDVAARALAQQLSKLLGQEFVIENRPGAGGNLATGAVVKASNDGYTLLMGTVASTVHTTLSPQLNFSFAKDLAPIALVATVPNILVVHPSLGVKSVGELIKLVKSKPGEINYASSGVGTAPHLSAELFKVEAGLNMVHVPYQGSSKAITDVIAGRVPVMFSPASTALPHIKSGALVALASTRPQRTAAAPDLPTMDEEGLKGFDTGVWFGLMAPAGTPKAIIDKLADATNKAVDSKEVIKALHQQGIDTIGSTPEEFARYIASETKKWAKVIEAAGLMKTKK